MWFVAWLPVGLVLLGAVHLGWALGSGRVGYRWLWPAGAAAVGVAVPVAASVATGPGGVMLAVACTALVVVFATGVGWIIGTSEGRVTGTRLPQLVAVWITWIVLAAPWLWISYALDTWDVA